MKRFRNIVIFLAICIATITLWNYFDNSQVETVYVPLIKEPAPPSIPLEKGVFKRSSHALEYANMPIDKEHQRSLDTYYNNRAYPGAPPSIPHPLEAERNMGAKTCLKCHQNGGFVKKFNASAPITPHPEYVNCRQCHVAQKTQSLFIASNFKKIEAPSVGNNNALLGSPPMIPHQIRMRESCLSCHAGPSAPKEIRVSHPERVNCRQCHVPTDLKVNASSTFIRKTNYDK